MSNPPFTATITQAPPEVCEWCHHSLVNNSHGVDQADFSGTKYLGSCMYCKNCQHNSTDCGESPKGITV